jgi:hypothetical protein
MPARTWSLDGVIPELLDPAFGTWELIGGAIGGLVASPDIG